MGRFQLWQFLPTLKAFAKQSRRLLARLMGRSRGDLLVPDQVFLPDELLFRRIRPGAETVSTDTGKHPAFNEICFPRFSLNRGKYSSPEDVLKPDHPGWGIFQFAVGDIPDKLYCESSKFTYTFPLFHDPIQDNFAHSEIHSFSDDLKRDNPHAPSKTIRNHFRFLIQERALIIKEPSQLDSSEKT